MTTPAALSLIVRCVIPASPARLFEAWTSAAEMRAWWGPPGVRCIHAEIDARVGGRYRLDNELPDGRVVSITGRFFVVEPPERLVYTWTVGAEGVALEQVTVHFRAQGSQTEVIVIHERIADERVRDEHARGWEGCLDRLAALVSAHALGD